MFNDIKFGGYHNSELHYFISLPCIQMDSNMTWGGMWTWVIILILFLFFSWNSAFGANNVAAFPYMAATNWVANAFGNCAANSFWPCSVEMLMNNNTSWEQQVAGLQAWYSETAWIMQGLNNLNTTVLQGFMWLQPNFCEINRNIDRSIFEAQKNTCEIITNQNCNTQKILDLINQNTITQLRTDLQSAQLTLANANQSQYLISQLKQA